MRYPIMITFWPGSSLLCSIHFHRPLSSEQLAKLLNWTTSKPHIEANTLSLWGLQTQDPRADYVDDLQYISLHFQMLNCQSTAVYWTNSRLYYGKFHDFDYNSKTVYLFLHYIHLRTFILLFSAISYCTISVFKTYSVHF